MLLQNVLSDNLEIFDIVNLITVVIALKIKKQKHTKISYNELVRLSRKCYEKVISSKERRQYLEAYMYLVLFNWPTESRSKDIICSIDQLRDATKRWKEAFYENHPRLKERANKSHGKRDTTIFFLGKGIEMDTIVHYEELGDPYNRRFIKGDKIWETPDFVTKLLRIQGTLINEGTEVSCNITPLTGGLTPFVVPTSLQIVNRSLWQKKIYFLLGFGWAGITAYDVRQSLPSNVHHTISEVGNDVHQSLSSEEHHMTAEVGSSNSNPQTSSGRKQTIKITTHDEFIEKIDKLRKELDQIRESIKKEKKGKRVSCIFMCNLERICF